MKNECFIKIENLSLVYELYYDKTNTLKEYFANLFKKRNYIDKSKDKLYALNNISLTINHGERLGIIGLNGAGKSTLLKVLSGILKPTYGKVYIKGSVQPLIEVGAGFNPEFSGRENIYLNGAMLGFTKKEIFEKEKDIIEFSELQDFIGVPIKYYSTGMVVRLAFSIATIIKPEILLLDEMLSAGDLSFISKARQRMDEILRHAKILVIASHDLGLIDSLASRTIVLDHGVILFDGNTQDAIAFFKDYVEKKVHEKRDVDEKKDFEESPFIDVQNFHCRNILNSSINIYPDDDVEFYLKFKLNEEFQEFFINLVIQDPTSDNVVHFRNDYSGIILKNLTKGVYEVTIIIKRIPFKSGIYSYYYRLFGKRHDDRLMTKDVANLKFEIQGEKHHSDLIKHEWKIINLEN